MTDFQLSVPGNILLCGEYAVTEPSGLGLAISVEPRILVTAKPASRWTITGIGPREGLVWSPQERSAEDPFVGKLWSAITREIGIPQKAASLVVDTRPFFDGSGRKRGFGSSAALAVGLTVALIQLSGRSPGDADVQIAVRAHRWAQGGRGSGYDVLTSWFGGEGLVLGGASPEWRALGFESLGAMALFPGPAAVETPGSVSRYVAWKTSSPKAAQRFMKTNNDAVTLLATQEGHQCRQNWERVRELGLEVGRSVGRPADLPREADWGDELFTKAVGAGNETGLAIWWGHPAAVDWPPSMTPLSVTGGWKWE